MTYFDQSRKKSDRMINTESWRKEDGNQEISTTEILQDIIQLMKVQREPGLWYNVEDDNDRILSLYWALQYIEQVSKISAWFLHYYNQ